MSILHRQIVVHPEVPQPSSIAVTHSKGNNAVFASATGTTGAVAASSRQTTARLNMDLRIFIPIRIGHFHCGFFFTPGPL